MSRTTRSRRVKRLDRRDSRSRLIVCVPESVEVLTVVVASLLPDARQAGIAHAGTHNEERALWLAAEVAPIPRNLVRMNGHCASYAPDDAP